MRPGERWSRLRGFTMIELLIVMAMIALLVSIVTPRYFRHIDLAKRAVLHQQLAAVRDAIDKYHADHDRYPATLAELVSGRYLRALPEDPITERSDTWKIEKDAGDGGVFNLASGAPGQDQDGKAYASY